MGSSLRFPINEACIDYTKAIMAFRFSKIIERIKRIERV